ncbi:RNA polymerase I enhancer binding protein [Gaertneriomyces sp. JEL0708]|nr:RNA polymerase I enhancer binding protein [Gaertneriomyces sp. JEL0708]
MGSQNRWYPSARGVYKPPPVGASSSTANGGHQHDPDTDTRPPSLQLTSASNFKVHAEFNSTYNQGRFTSLEEEAVERALDQYCQEQGIPREHTTQLVFRRTKLPHRDEASNPYWDKRYKMWIKDVWKLARINRSLHQLQKYLKTKYSWHLEGEKEGTGPQEWSADDERRLKELVMLKGVGNWKEIDKELGRPGSRLKWARMEALASGNLNNGKWLPDELQRLTLAVKEIMTREGITEPHKVKHWGEISAKVGTRSVAQCHRRWHRTPDLNFSCGNVTPQEDAVSEWTVEHDRELVTKMLTLFPGAYDESEVQWDELATPEWGAIGAPARLRNRWRRLRDAASDVEMLTFHETMERVLAQLRDAPLLRASKIVSHVDLAKTIHEIPLEWDAHDHAYTTGPNPVPADFSNAIMHEMKLQEYPGAAPSPSAGPYIPHENDVATLIQGAHLGDLANRSAMGVANCNFKQSAVGSGEVNFAFNNTGSEIRKDIMMGRLTDEDRAMLKRQQKEWEHTAEQAAPAIPQGSNTMETLTGGQKHSLDARVSEPNTFIAQDGNPRLSKKERKQQKKSKQDIAGGATPTESQATEFVSQDQQGPLPSSPDAAKKKKKKSKAKTPAIEDDSSSKRKHDGTSGPESDALKKKRKEHKTAPHPLVEVR